MEALCESKSIQSNGYKRKSIFSSSTNSHFQNEPTVSAKSFLMNFLMHENRKLFSYQWLCTESNLEFEARGNSDIAYLF